MSHEPEANGSGRPAYDLPGLQPNQKPIDPEKSNGANPPPGWSQRK